MKNRQKSDPKRQSNPTVAPKESVLTWLALGLIASLAWCGAFKPLWYDEAYTIINFCSKPFRYIITNYPLPNNHIAYSLLLHTWSIIINDPAMIRPDTWILRVPSLVLSSLGVVAFFLFARRAITPVRPLALLATFFYATQPQVLQFAGGLRGYGPSMAWLCIVLAGAAYADRLPQWIFALLAGGGLWLANYTLPTNLWFTLPLSLSIILLAAGRSTGLIPAPNVRFLPSPPRPWRFPWKAPAVLWSLGAALAAFALTLLAYTPVRAQLARHAQTGFALPGVKLSVFSSYFAHWGQLLEAAEYWPGRRWLAAALLVLGCVALVRRLPHSREARVAAIFIFPILLFSMPLASLTGQVGFTRNYGIAAPLLATLQCWNLMWPLQRLWNKRIGGDKSKPASSGRTWPLAQTVLFALVLAGGAWNFYHHLDFDFRPDQAIQFVKSRMIGSTAVIYGPEGDPLALEYYAKARGIDAQCKFYAYVPKARRRTMMNLFIIATSDGELSTMLREWELPADRISLELLKNMGRYRVYQYHLRFD